MPRNGCEMRCQIIRPCCPAAPRLRLQMPICGWRVPGTFPRWTCVAVTSISRTTKAVTNNVAAAHLDHTLEVDDTDPARSRCSHLPGRPGQLTNPPGPPKLLDATGQDLDDVQRAVVRETQNSYRAVMAGIQEVQAFEQARFRLKARWRQPRRVLKSAPGPSWMC